MQKQESDSRHVCFCLLRGRKVQEHGQFFVWLLLFQQLFWLQQIASPREITVPRLVDRFQPVVGRSRRLFSVRVLLSSEDKYETHRDIVRGFSLSRAYEWDQA